MDLTRFSARQRLVALGVVVLLLAGALWWWRSHGGDSDTPFPEIGFVREDDEVIHTVTHRKVDPVGHLDDPVAGVTDSDVSTWEGALTFDSASPNDFDADGRYRRTLAATNQEIGVAVTASDWDVWHVDADGDGTIDLSVFRRPLPSDEVRLPATVPVGFLTQPYEEYVVGRAGHGDLMAGLYTSGGLRPAICDSGLFSDPGPLSPDEAQRLLESDDLTIWCTRPRQQPEPQAPAEPEDEEGEVGDDEQTRPFQGIRSIEPVTGSSIDGPAQDGDPPVPMPPFRLPNPCEALKEHYDQEKERAAERAEEAEEALEPLVDLLSDIAKGDQPKIVEMFNQLLEVNSKGEFVRLILDWIAEAGVEKANEYRDELKDEALDALYGQLHVSPSDQHLIALGEAMAGATTPADFVISVTKWAADVAKDVAERLDELGSDTEGMRDEECQQQLCSDPAIALRFGPACAPESQLPDIRPGPDRPSGRHKAEPHFTTFDGLSYDFQAVGEYTTVLGEGFTVQARYANLREGSVSVAVAAAAQLPETTESISVYVDGVSDDGWTVYLDDQPYLVPFGISTLGDYNLALDGARLRIETDGSVGVEVLYMETNRPLFNIVSVDIEESMASTVIGGLLGDVDGDPSNDHKLPDGTVIPVDEMDFDTLYTRFGEEWRVKTTDKSLFVYAPGTDPSTFYNPRFPAGEATLATLSQSELVRGLRPCLDAGVWIEPALSECAFDVAMMDDDLWVQTGTQSQQMLPDTGTPLALPGSQFEGHGGYTLWEHDAFVVRALIAGDARGSTAQLVVRALEVEVGDSTTLVYPGWQDPPPTIDLPGERRLQISPWGRAGMVVALDGSLDDVGGLATEQGEQVAEGTAGTPAISPESAQRWATDFPHEER